MFAEAIRLRHFFNINTYAIVTVDIITVTMIAITMAQLYKHIKLITPEAQLAYRSR